MPDSVPEMYKFDFMHHMPKHILFVSSYKLHIELSFTIHRYKQDMLEMHITVQDMRGLDSQVSFVRAGLLFFQLDE